MDVLGAVGGAIFKLLEPYRHYKLTFKKSCKFEEAVGFPVGKVEPWQAIRERAFKKMTCNAEIPKLELKLNLSPPRENLQVQSPKIFFVYRDIISKFSPDDSLCCSSSPEATSVMLSGCPRCLVYVMLFLEDPKCPKCKSTVFA